MAANSRTVLLIPPTKVLTASANTNAIVIPEAFTAFIAYLVGVNVSGTSPTMNVVIQTGLRDKGAAVNEGDQCDGSYVFDDYAAFAQVTTSANQTMRVVGGGNGVAVARPSGTLTASTINNGPIGSVMRARIVLAGTNPVYTGTYLVIQFIP